MKPLFIDFHILYRFVSIIQAFFEIRAHNQLKCQPLGCHAQRRKACGQAGHERGAYIVFGRGKRSRGRDGFISNLNGNQTKQNRSENIFSWKIYFINKGQIRILRVCVIARYNRRSLFQV